MRSAGSGLLAARSNLTAFSVSTLKWQFALLAIVLLCSNSVQAASGCPAEYSKEQCEQASDEQENPPGGGGGGPRCTYYLCSNSAPDVQAFYVWCEEKASYQNCPTVACYYRECLGSSCTIDTSKACSTCPQNPGSNAHVSECPWT
jgi:hypothetical protein